MVTASTIDKPTGLPESYPLAESKLYVRECYPMYYNLVMDLLNSKEIRLVSLMGTSGIGKSVFYLYFFERYRRVNKDKKDNTASSSRDRVMKDCVLWKEDGTVEAIFTKVSRDACELPYARKGVY
jgi:hypothetical protein